ncbi:DUF6270 domain-containing protein [Helicobacter sp.]|uniref:DUF6270 domain-containing protein n=1 Tax=Helicobacter sp. TaxID=218 RepID=UPI0019A2AE51|nr:DUF6270 domain-containing protein [Helicobacter sp.]MBD5164985.1 hypothetical protein [Helicobacter sp.]
MDIQLIAPFNSLLENYYQVLQSALPKATFIEYSQDLLEADPNHRWGLAAMHYKKEFYEESLKSLRGFCREIKK